jgi:hypothetical protein
MARARFASECLRPTHQGDGDGDEALSTSWPGHDISKYLNCPSPPPRKPSCTFDFDVPPLELPGASAAKRISSPYASSACTSAPLGGIVDELGEDQECVFTLEADDMDFSDSEAMSPWKPVDMDLCHDDSERVKVKFVGRNRERSSTMSELPTACLGASPLLMTVLEQMAAEAATRGEPLGGRQRCGTL